MCVERGGTGERRGKWNVIKYVCTSFFFRLHDVDHYRKIAF